MERLKKLIPFIGLFIVVVLFGVLTGGNLVLPRNIKLIFNQALFLMISGLGVTFVMAQGSLDLSQGSLLGISSAMAATVAMRNTALSLPAALATGFIVGFVNGTLLAKFKIPSFIVTLCMLFILRGMTVFATHAGSIPIPLEMYSLDSFNMKIIILIVITILAAFSFNYTRLGKYCKAIGSGELCAKYSGVQISKVKIFSYIIAGTLCGLCGFLNIIRTGAADSKTGILFEIDLLIALVIGGMPLTGGAGAKIQSAIIGGLILAILSNGMVLLGVRIEIQQAIKGIIFLIAVYLSFERESVVMIK